MSLLNQAIKNLINGVSQQPPTIRLPSQAEEQVNGLPSVSSGLSKRPPTQHLARVMDAGQGNTTTHLINRDASEKYVLLAQSGELKVFDFAGNEQTVNFPDGKGYLNVPDGSRDFSMVTVADYTFVLNKQSTVRVQDPYAGVTLEPAYETRKVITIAPLPGQKVWSYNNTTLKPAYRFNVNGAEVYGFYKTTTYERNLNPSPWVFDPRYYVYQLDPQTPWYNDAAPAADYHKHITPDRYARILGEALRYHNPNLVIDVVGNKVYVPNDMPLSIADKSREFYFEDVIWPPPQGQSDSLQTRTAAGTRLLTGSRYSVSTETRIVGYTSSDGSNIPQAANVKQEGIVYVKQGDYSSNYKVFVNGTQRASFSTPSDNRSQITTDYIAGQLYSQLNSAISGSYDITLSGNVIRIRAKDEATNFSLKTEDSGGNYLLIAAKGRVQSFADLPPRCFDGFIIKVAGDSGVEADDYYVRYTEGDEGEEKGSGSWVETHQRGLNNEFVNATMPHVLVREADGTFTFKQAEWEKRKVGDLTSNPDPTFVNRKLSDVFFYRNRLGFLCDENVIFSEAGGFFNFYPTTVMTYLDSAPIDVSISNDKVSILRFAVPFHENLILFSDQTQFAVKAQGILSPSTISIDITTQFEASLRTKPVGAGKNIFFPVLKGKYAGIREYYIEEGTDTKDAADITAHVPWYIDGDVTSLTASSNEDMVICAASGAPNSLYVYNYYWAGNEKAQSAWHKWDMDGRVLNAIFISSDLFIVIERDDGIFLERIDMSNSEIEKVLNFKSVVLLDRRVFCDAGTSEFPFDLKDAVAVNREGEVFRGEDAVTQAALNQDLYVGIPYRFSYKLSEQVMRNSADEGKSSLNAGRLQLRNMKFIYSETGYFEVHVTPLGRQTYINTFTGTDRGVGLFEPENAVLTSGEYKFPLMSKSDRVDIEVISDSHLPVALQSAEWEGFYHSRSTSR
ncbi:hypothetical protein LH51_17655 [Nitrincola sp. A-D6]|uniref:phage nozzle protein n=1 Tax=Nitrincola sp. A-D6 TaxID=1545442 RepID=UPI00051F8F08|nr:hypothetical protein [Nitrincola sp. A-D6]KGK41050.1 hypothetical protein LH51_17655 [Nitrincola sp. A-D6]